MNQALGEIPEYMDALDGSCSLDPKPVSIPKNTKKQTKLKIKPDYYGLKINECELSKHNITIMEIVNKFDFDTWVVGRDEVLGKKSIPHYHIHFKSKKNIEALRKQKQVVMPNWGRSTKLGPPSADKDNWYCWAGYAVKEKLIGMSNDITDLDKMEIDKHAHTQAAFKKSKLDWSNKQDEKKQEKKDLETRIYEQLDQSFSSYHKGDLGKLACLYCELYMKEVGEMPCATAYKSKVWKYLYIRKYITMDTYVYYTSDFFSMTNI